MSTFILALDQGTTSSRSIVFDHDGRIVASAQEEFQQILPRPGHVEHDPEDIWRTQISTAKEAMAAAEASAEDIAAIGVTNQRETTILWERATGKPVANAMVWQSRASAPICEQLKQNGLAPLFHEKTGLVVDPYFSGTKIKHLLDHNEELRTRGEKGEILFGTVDSFLIWRMTGGRVHVTDVSNASRTLLLNIHTLDWDEELLGHPRRPASHAAARQTVEPHFRPHRIGNLRRSDPHRRRRGDQQAATFGQVCFEPRRSEEHVWNRLLHDDEHGREAGGVEEQFADDGRLADW